jgi:hypothetical protein
MPDSCNIGASSTVRTIIIRLAKLLSREYGFLEETGISNIIE